MSPEERVSILLDGVAALRAIEARRLQRLPAPDRENAALLHDVRDIQRLVDRLELDLAVEGFDEESVRIRDSFLSMHFDTEDIAAFEALANDDGWGTPYREGQPPIEQRDALLRLAHLARMYERGDFMPPPSYFGIDAPEA